MYQIPSRLFRAFIVAICAMSALIPAAIAQNYPDKPVRWIVGYPPGGAIDFLARLLSPKLSADLGQQVIVDNRTGAAGIVAMQAGAQARADGYTIISVGNGELVYNLGFYKSLPYDADRDFIPVTLVGKIPFLLVVQPSSPAASVKDFLEFARAQGGKMNYASGGVGHPNYIAMELLKNRAGLQLVPVHYRGMAPALQDFLAGSTQAIFMDLATGVAQIKGGKAKVLAVSTKERLEALSNVPTLEESGVKNYDVYAWTAIAVPAKTPAPVVARLNKAFAKALAHPEVVTRMKDAGIEAKASTAKELAELIRDDREMSLPLIRSLNVKLD